MPKIRVNILLIAGGIFLVIIGLLVVLSMAIAGANAKENQFVIGALLGLIGTGITALTSLGNNILEKDNQPDGDR